MQFVLTPERKRRADELVALYPKRRAALLPLLWLVQEQEGWVPPEAEVLVADLAGITPAEAHEVASFYTMFNRRQIGRHHIQVCAGVCCRLKGSDWLLGFLKEKLGVDAGETTPDGKFHLSTVECLGSCGTSPMMQIGDDYYENLDAGKVDGILEKLTL
ncbi:MAG: NAD(P)H-dependent oxidoreductase subunit E [Pseudomonadota bacterium]